jgi:hypothetical protein
VKTGPSQKIPDRLSPRGAEAHGCFSTCVPRRPGSRPRLLPAASVINLADQQKVCELTAATVTLLAALTARLRCLLTVLGEVAWIVLAPTATLALGEIARAMLTTFVARPPTPSRSPRQNCQDFSYPAALPS